MKNNIVTPSSEALKTLPALESVQIVKNAFH